MFSLIRKLPHFKGKFRLVNFFFRNKRATAREVPVTGRWDCKYILPNLTEPVAFDIFVDGVYEPDTISFIVDKLPANAWFLDLGMNIGAISIPVKTLRPDVNIIGVEAAPWVYEHLQTNLRLNAFHDITVINKALFDEDSKIIPFYSPADAFGKGSLSPVFTNEAIQVTTITLDTLVNQNGNRQIDFIKIDVEGYEYYVFKGGAITLTSQQAPDILFEFVDWAEERAHINKGKAQEILMSYGYKIYQVHENRPHMKAISEPVTTGSCMFYATKRS
jgi:FkbM family methyltransferase